MSFGATRREAHVMDELSVAQCQTHRENANAICDTASFAAVRSRPAELLLPDSIERQTRGPRGPARGAFEHQRARQSAAEDEKVALALQHAPPGIVEASRGSMVSPTAAPFATSILDPAAANRQARF